MAVLAKCYLPCPWHNTKFPLTSATVLQKYVGDNAVLRIIRARPLHEQQQQQQQQDVKQDGHDNKNGPVAETRGDAKAGGKAAAGAARHVAGEAGLSGVGDGDPKGKQQRNEGTAKEGVEEERKGRAGKSSGKGEGGGGGGGKGGEGDGKEHQTGLQDAGTGGRGGRGRGQGGGRGGRGRGRGQGGGGGGGDVGGTLDNVEEVSVTLLVGMAVFVQVVWHPMGCVDVLL